ncbi:hypothetical protein EV175_003931 [Coemansia sp. RSA 1933]|nr:hypothetical protein EV175_003931 [Coemansia sp. RSA 1933]
MDTTGSFARMPPQSSRVATLFGILLATANILYTGLKSSARYFLQGPLAPSWDIGTNVRYDLFRYMYCQNSSGILHRASLRWWVPISDYVSRLVHGERYPCTVSCIQVPAIAISTIVAQCAGRWANQLQRISTKAVAAGDIIQIECIAHRDIPPTTDGGGGCPIKVILYFHGGAYVTGSVTEYRFMHTRLSFETRLPVYSVEYRLAPQSRYPTQLYDAFCAYMYLRHDLGYNSHDIIISGDSAGGNLALALWQLIHAQGLRIAAMVLLSPRVDITYTRETWQRSDCIDIMQPVRLDDPESSLCKLLGPLARVDGITSDPFLAPINADLAQLPPTLVQAGGQESMYADICEFVTRASASGAVELQVLPDGVHVSHFVTPDLRGVDKLWHSIGAFVRSL